MCYVKMFVLIHSNTDSLRNLALTSPAPADSISRELRHVIHVTVDTLLASVIRIVTVAYLVTA